jgi:hypothetical protein
MDTGFPDIGRLTIQLFFHLQSDFRQHHKPEDCWSQVYGTFFVFRPVIGTLDRYSYLTFKEGQGKWV